MKRVLAVLVLVGASAFQVVSQVWVEEYQFSGTGLEVSKWTASRINSGGTFPLSTFTGTSMVIYQPINNNGNLTASFPSTLVWYQSLPLNQSWSVFQRFRSNPVDQRDAHLSLSVRGSSGLMQDNLYYSSDTGSSISGINNLADDFYWLGVTHDVNSRTLSNLLALNSSNQIPSTSAFQVLGNSISTANNENSTVNIGNIFYFTQKGSYELTDFKIVPYAVPEPSLLSLLLAGGAVLMAGRRRK